jgi:hypothetical protein
MQINPFGFPLGNGLGAAPSAGAAQTDFAAVLGLAFGNAGNAGFAANAALPGEQPPTSRLRSPRLRPRTASCCPASRRPRRSRS